MRVSMVVLLVSVAGCAGGSGGGKTTPAKLEISEPTPDWLKKSVFLAKGPMGPSVYGVGSAEVEFGKNGCVSPSFTLDSARRRASAEIGKWLHVEQQSEGDALVTRSASTMGAPSPISYWYDGDVTVWSLVAGPVPEGRQGESVAPALPGKGIAHVITMDRIKQVGYARAYATGQCDDPYTKSGECCGPYDGMCRDETRYSQAFQGGVCRCGTDAPCRFDYECAGEAAAGECRCDGDRCPCGTDEEGKARNCESGQYCLTGKICRQGTCWSGCIDQPVNQLAN